MKLVRFFLKGGLLALLTSFVTGVFEILLYVLSFSFSFLYPLVESVVTVDLNSPWLVSLCLAGLQYSLVY